ncbi:acyl-CoA dehydrogenase family protein [Paracandidimonas lactea]|uniref:acyl-CoA dehydrogenase family protein n=1 Tax=Paracandidimonas lactea TaxID=2895524 RepID=UPI001F25E54F|nr:acyl-CoA dehydrogenase family protein [Paracandidimonas lactea]
MSTIEHPEFPSDHDAFRTYVRGWLTSHYAAFRSGWPGDGDPRCLKFRRAWEDELCRYGMAGLGWPRQYGGHELDLARQAIFHEEHALCGAPLGVNLIGHGILAPTLLHFGTEAQKREFLPGILKNSNVWCQGYSEPGAGSDLAALRTRARRDGDDYVLNGHKIWTSFADRADWCFVLARTDPDRPRHRGLSFLLVDMRLPGVRVEPIRQLTGEAEFCEVFFENVRVPADCLVGAENDGWKIAMAAASFERGTYFLPRLVRFRQELAELREQLQSDPFTNAAVRRQWARLAADSRVLGLKTRRALRQAIAGEPPGPEGSSTKVHWSEAHQRMLDFAVTRLGIDVCQPGAIQQGGTAQTLHAYLWSRAETILAGTSEIQRNIIAEKILGLPKGA